MLRRAPTAITLRSSDVTELQATLDARQGVAASSPSTAARPTQPTTERDPVLAREDAARRAQAARTQGQRIGA